MGIGRFPIGQSGGEIVLFRVFMEINIIRPKDFFFEKVGIIYLEIEVIVVANGQHWLLNCDPPR